MDLEKNFKGFLIAIEGIDGCGKSSLSENLISELNNLGFETVKTKEPGATPLGQYLRDILQNRTFDIDDKAEFLLFAADRAQHIHQVVIPALKSNKIVISDRMTDSSVAYQGYARGLNIDIINKINDWTTNSIKPDLTIYLKIDYKTAISRVKHRYNKNEQELTHFEKEKEEFFKKVITGFDNIFKIKDKDKILIIDGTQNQNTIILQALEHILDKVKIKKKLNE